jgi:hypothetical protein
MKEIFKDVPGYEGLYQVSDLGRVKSLARILKRDNIFLSTSKKRDNNFASIKEKILKLSINSQGYYLVQLRKENKGSCKTVHKLVAMAFLNHTPDRTHKIVVDHIDNDKSNNKLENLQLISQRENVSKDKNNVSSKYTGVSLVKASGKWRAAIRISSKTKYLGTFDTEAGASEAYQKILNLL